MRLIDKIMLGVGAVILIIGSIIFAKSLKAIDYDMGILIPKKTFEKQEYKAKSVGYKRVIVDDQPNNVRVEHSEDGRIHVEYHTNEEENYVIIDEDGVFKIRFDDRSKGLIDLGLTFNRPDTTLVLYLPEDYQGELILETNRGSIEVTAGYAKLENLNASCHEGNVLIKNCETAELIMAKSETGNVEVYTVTASDVTLYTEGGTITVMDAVAGSGEIAALSYGGVTVESCISSSFMAEAEIGEISITALKTGNITTANKNGGVTMSLIGDASDYNIVSAAVNGTATAPDGNPDGEYLLYTKTVNGNITIEIAE